MAKKNIAALCIGVLVSFVIAIGGSILVCLCFRRLSIEEPAIAG